MMTIHPFQVEELLGFKTGNRLDTVLILSLGTFIKIYFDCLARRTEFILKISLFNVSFFDISNDLELHKTA